MNKILAAAVPVVLFLHWLAVGQVTATVDGVPVAIPVLAIAAATIVAVAAIVAALLAFRIRIERAAPPAWQARKAGAR